MAVYKAEVVAVAEDLPSGFLAEDRSNLGDYERVPIAFSFQALDECAATDANISGPKPYDHVMFNPELSTEVDTEFDFRVII